jgi:phospholipid/cholesterol/gamma-HCH transport system ATP-binding protein
MSAPVLEVIQAMPRASDPNPIAAPVTLTLQPGELALVDAADAGLARALTELCTGVVPLEQGMIRLLGADLAALPRPAREELRGRIGLAPGEEGWLPHLSMAENMLLLRRHHGETPGLREAADRLARLFGLDGVPRATPHELSRLDLARAGCARAFLGRPALLLLESPLDSDASDTLVAPIRAALEAVLADGAAALWMTRSHHAWEDPDFPATQRWHLGTQGLVAA